MTSVPAHRRTRGATAPHHRVNASRVSRSAWTALNWLTSLAVVVVMTASAAAMVAAAPEVSPAAPAIVPDSQP
ncbi:hypothetical protein QN367_13075 [Cryobacterium sp. RTS3]|uniref:hypothetical protein n=1 Tax=Cryobacterium sp. RTS3 TaxID=3048643 RepID=UPI002B23A554|nr:hypothetical protein [Cryobacterium sp. RTS3]MEB0000031.1 hypothetical protein [Cryobacterium sp. RTS3]